MKRITIAVILTVTAVLLLCSCGKGTESSPAELSGEESANTGIANPVLVITEQQAKDLCPAVFAVPDNAENVRWGMISSSDAPAKDSQPLIELSFECDGKEFTAREQHTGEKAVYSAGMYYEWTVSEPFTFTDRNGKELSGECRRYNGENESAELCCWYDPTLKMSYSVSITAKSLDGFDLQAIVEEITP